MVIDINKTVELCFGEVYDPLQKYIIAVQGCSTSGKTTIAKELASVINKNSHNSCKAIVREQDNFYKHKPAGLINVKDKSNYDMDNPASIDWPAFERGIKSIIAGESSIKKFTYEYANCTRTETVKENKGYNVIIVEGLFAHNLFNEQVFNIAEFDCLNTQKKIENSYIPNYFEFKEAGDFKIIKIFLDLDDQTMQDSRILVDFNRCGRSKEDSLYFFNKFVKPATDMWIRPTGKDSADISLLSGTRDIEETSKVFYAISKFFESDVAESYLESFLSALEENAKKNYIK